MEALRPTPEEQVIIIKQLLKSDRLGVGELAYIIALDWIRKWKDAVGFSGKAPPTGECPPIDNSDLVSEDGRGVKENKTETVDFSVFSSGVWETFLSWYGGGPAISVEVVYDRARKQNVPLLRMTQLNIVFNGTVKKIQFSKYRFVEELRDAVCGFLKIDREKYGLYEGWKATKGELLDMKMTLAELYVNDGDAIIVDLLVNPKFQQVKVELPNLNVAEIRHSRSIMGRFTPKYTPGLTGLTNFGNTCFFNSSLQCLLHTMPLVRFFQETDWRNDTNPTNPLGTKLEIVNEFYSVLSEVWSGNVQNISPRSFLATLRTHASHFSGYLQQDAHELLVCLLDYIHEDLNRVKKKPIVETVEGNGENDDEAAKSSWGNHKLRNDSVIVDLFHGLLKSKLVCPNCGKCVCVFDPFVSISLPIPAPKMLSPKFTFVPYDPLLPKVIMQIPIQFGLQVSTFKATLCEMMGRQFDCLFAFRDVHNRYEFITGPTKPGLNQTLYIFEVPTTDDVMYCITTLAVTVQSVFTVTSKSLEDSYLLQLPDEVVDGAVMQSLIEKRFEFLWEGELAFDVPSDLISLRKAMKTSNSCNKLDYEKPGFSKEMRFQRNKKIPFISTRTVTAIVNTKFVNSTDHFNWGRLKRATIEQPPSELEADNPTLHSCLENFSKAVVLDEQNQWYCPTCKEFVCAEKKMDIWKLPRCLVVQFKRFCATTIGLKKLETNIAFPDEMDFNDFVVGPHTEEEVKYELYAVIQHFGQLNGGHYIANAYCASNEKWESFNDNCISEIMTNSAHQAGAYVLFYIRK